MICMHDVTNSWIVRSAWSPPYCLSEGMLPLAMSQDKQVMYYYFCLEAAGYGMPLRTKITILICSGNQYFETEFNSETNLTSIL